MLGVNKIDTSVNNNYTVGKSNGFNNDESDGNYNLLRASYVNRFLTYITPFTYITFIKSSKSFNTS